MYLHSLEEKMVLCKQKGDPWVCLSIQYVSQTDVRSDKWIAKTDSGWWWVLVGKKHFYEKKEMKGGSCSCRCTDRATLMDSNAFSTQKHKILVTAAEAFLLQTHIHTARNRVWLWVYTNWQQWHRICCCSMKEDSRKGCEKDDIKK